MKGLCSSNVVDMDNERATKFGAEMSGLHKSCSASDCGNNRHSLCHLSEQEMKQSMRLFRGDSSETLLWNILIDNGRFPDRASQTWIKASCENCIGCDNLPTQMDLHNDWVDRAISLQ